MTKEQLERFWSKVDTSGECWTWHGARSRSGYGKFAVRTNGTRRHLRAHRIAWEIENGTIPDGMVVCHRCDNPCCVRVDHLFIGTPRDNTHDALRKGRLRTGPKPAASVLRGERANNARLTVGDVVEIRRLAASGLAQSRIGERFGIRQAQVSAIVTGRSWSHVTDGVLPKLSRRESGQRRRAA